MTAPAQRRGLLAVQVALVLACLAVFGPVVQFEFVQWDDDVNILNNRNVSSLSPENLQWMFTDVHRAHRYLPLGWLTYAVERTLWGVDSFLFHTTNLLLHVINTLLVFSLWRGILGRWSGRQGGAHSMRVILAAGGGALLWALNPLRVEVVSWSSSIIYLMATFWFLLSLQCYCRAHAREAVARGWLALSMVFFLVSLLTYPVVLLGAVVFVLLDIFVFKRLDLSPGKWLSARGVLIEKVPYLAASGIMLGITVATRNVGLERSYSDTLALFDIPHRIMQGFFGWAYYFWKPWWPTDLAPKYGNLIIFEPGEMRFVLSALLVIGISLLAILTRTGRRLFLGFWIAHLVLYLPLIGLTEHPHSLYDRYSYAPGMLWAGLVALGLWWGMGREKVRWLAGGGLAGCALAFIVACSDQILVWQNTASVRLRVAWAMGHHVSGAEHLEVAGTFLLRRDDAAGARLCFARALELDPENADYRILLGDALAALGREAEAREQYDVVTRSQPEDEMTLHNLGVAYCKLGRFAEGIRIFAAILVRDPGHENARHNLDLARKALREQESEVKTPKDRKVSRD